MQKLKATEVAAFRAQTWEEQGYRCALTGAPLKLADAVLDHDHKTGECRGVLHRGVNTMLGKIENHRRISGLSSDADLYRMLKNVVVYLSQSKLGVRYPTHRDAEEKRVRRNTLARKRRTTKAT